jgi:light-regulated signal transduction histidine kinase (bacteriophytochrome)
MCYEWNPAVIWLHVVSDAFITLAYYSIPLTLIYFVRKRKDLVFDWMFLCFAAFIVACGTTHLMEILNIWHPTYWLSGLIKAITAITSVITAILLVRLLPQALALRGPQEWRKINEELQQEISERRMAVDQVVGLNRELQTQAAKLEEANKELETFAYSVSHDLRAPLRHIAGFVDLLREETPKLTESGEHYLKVIGSSSRQMEALIENLLSFSRAGSTEMAQEWIDTAAVVERVREELSVETRHRKIEWKVGALPRVYVDGALFKQVWMNLLGNAVKYTRQRETAEISIGCVEKKGEFEFSVQDNGAGFDMRYVDKLFGVFQRLHYKEEFDGTGIGLANVRRVIARHGGRTWAYGEVDKGAAFFFTLPKTTPN